LTKYEVKFEAQLMLGELSIYSLQVIQHSLMLYPSPVHLVSHASLPPHVLLSGIIPFQRQRRVLYDSTPLRGHNEPSVARTASLATPSHLALPTPLVLLIVANAPPSTRQLADCLAGWALHKLNWRSTVRVNTVHVRVR